MMKLLTTISIALILISCGTNKKLTSTPSSAAASVMPACLQSIVDSMASIPNNAPQSVTRFSYNNQQVYYMVSPCCDKYNVVYDSSCNVLGYPDGGYTGKGDGKMPGFRDAATNGTIVWSKDTTALK